MNTRLTLWIQHEVAGSLRARWFIAYSAIFLAGGLALTALGVGDTVISGYRGFAKAFVGLIHLALLFVPLMALFPASATIADDRESGALEYFLAQPVTFGEVYLGKWSGVSAALLLSLTLGFGAAGALAVLRGVPPDLILLLYAFVTLLALAFVALGICLSAVAGSRARATTIGIVLWLFLVALGTLGVIVAFVRFGLPEEALTLWTFLNPVEAFRLGVIASLDTDLSLLGPIGAAIVERFGNTGTTGLAAASLLSWIVVPGLIGWQLFRRAP